MNISDLTSDFNMSDLIVTLDVTIHIGLSVRSIILTGDIFKLVRYELRPEENLSLLRNEFVFGNSAYP